MKKTPRRELAARAKSEKGPSLIVCSPWNNQKGPSQEVCTPCNSKKDPFFFTYSSCKPQKWSIPTTCTSCKPQKCSFLTTCKPCKLQKCTISTPCTSCKPKSSYANKGLQHIPGGVAQDVDCLLSVPPPTPHYAKPLQKKQPEPILTKSERARVAKPKI